MQPDNDLRFIRQAMYRLKQRYGSPCDYYKWLSETVNPDTGVIARSVEKYMLRKAIMLPSKTDRSFSYDLSYVAANKNFTYGGDYDKNSRFFLLDADDIAARFVLKANDYLIFKHKNYQIKSFELFDPSQAVFIHATHIEGTLPFETHTVDVVADIQGDESAST